VREKALCGADGPHVTGMRRQGGCLLPVFYEIMAVSFATSMATKNG